MEDVEGSGSQARAFGASGLSQLSMSDSPQSETPPRRRTVAAVTARRPFAVIGQPSEELRALVLEYGPCVPFPTITHFRAADRERWAGVLVLRASAWDASLDMVTRERRSIALVDVELTHAWPDDIARVRGEVELRAWLESTRRSTELTVRSRAPTVSAESASRVSLHHVPSEQGPHPQAVKKVVAVDTRTYARPGSELLIVAKAAELRARLFRCLRGVRPVRVVADLADLTVDDRDASRWLGVVVADASASPSLVSVLARAECVVVHSDENAALDEAGLKRWLWQALAFEYVNHAGVARVIADAFARAEEKAYPPSVELAGLYACTLGASQRSLALDMTEHTWRWYAKESARILGESNKVLAQRALAEAGCVGLLPPSRWLARDPVTSSTPWQSLRARVPVDILGAPLSCVPWADSKVSEVIRLSLEHGIQTVAGLLSLSTHEVGSQWDNQRVCDGLQEALLSTHPFASSAPLDRATTFTSLRDSLLAAMPSEEAALPLRVTSGVPRAASSTQRALRFHDKVLRALYDRLKLLLQAPASLDEIRQRDSFFEDLPSLLELQHFARVALRLPLFVTNDRYGQSIISATRPARYALPEFAEMRGAKMDDDGPLTIAPNETAAGAAPGKVSSVRPAKKTRPATQVPAAAPQSDLFEAERVLREAGKPTSRVDLMSWLGERATPTLYRMSGTRPFVELAASHWGLIDRDVPGGDDAFDAAVALLREAGSQRGAISDAIEQAVRSVSNVHSAWTREMVVAALRYART